MAYEMPLSYAPAAKKEIFIKKKQLNQELVDLTCEIEGLYAACDCMTIEVESLKRTETLE